MAQTLPDYHIHTTLSKHARGDMAEYVDCAIEAGLTEIGFSDHMPVMPEPKYCMSYDDLPRYRDAVADITERFAGRITIRFGCEMDIVPGHLDEIHRIIDDYRFDYVIGSIHYLDGWPFDQPQYSDRYSTEPLEKIYERFFDAVIAGMEAGFYDIIGHIDLIKCMGYRPVSPLTGLYESVADEVRRHDLAVEINTSGLDKPIGEQYPSRELLEILVSRGVPLTVGSDSHAPEQVGRHFDVVESMLRDIGAGQIAYFDNRVRMLRPLA